MRLDEMLVERIQALADGYFPAPEGSGREEGPRTQFVSYAQWRANQLGIKSLPGTSDGSVPSVSWIFYLFIGFRSWVRDLLHY
jgi:hypothetical protein